MVQQSAYSPDEIIEMINSQDVEEQGVGARNIWAFWESWCTRLGSEANARDTFKTISDRLLSLLLEHQDEIRDVETYSQPRYIWHFLLGLGVLHNEEAIPLIKEIVSDGHYLENVRGFAADALSRYPKGIIDSDFEEKLWYIAATDGSLPVRVNCFRAIAANYAQTKNDKIAKKLWNALEEQENPAIKTAVVLSIGEIGSKAVVPDLIHTLITRRTGAMKKDAGDALDRIAELNGLSSRDDLIKSMDDIDMD